MKKFLKILVLGAMGIGVLAGCSNDKPKSEVVSHDVVDSSEANSKDPISSSELLSSDSSNSSSSSSSSSIVVKTITGISLNTDGVKKAYEIGETLDLTNLVVNLNYSDGTSVATTDYTVSPAKGTVLNEKGNVTVTITYTLNDGATTFTKSFDVAVDKTRWGDAEALLMQTHLYGEVLPFTGFATSKVAYSADGDMIVISGGVIEDNTFSSYEAKILAAGFKAASNTSYKFKKTITTDNGDRFVQVFFGRGDNNEFYLEAYDPYYYAFPAAFMAYTVRTSFDSNVVIPAYEGADRYEISERDSAVFCYTNSTTALADYRATLTNNGFTIEDRLYNGFTMSYSTDRTFMILFNYDNNTKSLDIYAAPLDYWNGSLITGFFTKYNGEDVGIPSLEVTNGLYQFVESEYNQYFFEEGRPESIHAFMRIYNAAESDLTAYSTKIQALGWEITGNTVFTAKKLIEGKGVARFEFDFDARYNLITFTIYFKLDPLPGMAWPAEEIASILGSDITDTVPAFTGENNGFSVMTDAYGSFVMVELPQGTENVAAENYINNVLIPAGYTIYGNYLTVYVSPHNQILVQAYMGTSGSISITFKVAPFTTWPGTRLNRILNDMFGNITDTLPAYNGAVEYEIEEDYDAEEIYVYIDTGDVEIADAVDAYITTLTTSTTNKYTYIGDDADGDPHYLSPNKQIDVCPYDNGRDFALYITHFDLWPKATINEFFDDRGFTDTLPAFQGTYVSATATEEYPELVIQVNFASASEVEPAMNSYMTTLTTAQFTHSETLPFGFGEVYLSPSEEFTVTVSSYSTYFELRIDEAEKEDVNTNEFPMDVLVQYFPTCENLLPKLSSSTITSYSTNGYEGNAYVYAYFNSVDAMNAGYTQYLSALSGASFTHQVVWGSYDAYFSPDGTFFVVVDTYEDQMAVDIELYSTEWLY